MFRVAIIGADSMSDGNFCCDKCIFLLKDKNAAGEKIVINSVGDKFVDKFTQFYGIDCQYFLTDFEANGKNAFSIRNDDLLENSDAFIIFDSGSKDSEVMVALAKRHNIPYRLVKK